MLELRETATIAAPPALVYDVIVDLARYGAWNPWLVAARGVPRVGGPFVAVKAKLNGKTQWVQHRVVVADPGRAFGWEDVGLFTLFAKGDRYRTLRDDGSGGTAYSMTLSVRGVLSSLVERLYRDALVVGVREETLALRARAEALHRANG